MFRIVAVSREEGALQLKPSRRTPRSCRLHEPLTQGGHQRGANHTVVDEGKGVVSMYTRLPLRILISFRSHVQAVPLLENIMTVVRQWRHQYEPYVPQTQQRPQQLTQLTQLQDTKYCTTPTPALLGAPHCCFKLYMMLFYRSGYTDCPI